MKIKLIILLILFLVTNLSTLALDYGLRFKSHTYQPTERTGISLGHQGFRLDSDLTLDFDMDFYDNDRFGKICKITCDDGTEISFICTMEDWVYYPAIVINDDFNKIPVSFEASPTRLIHPSITLNKKENNVVFVFNENHYAFPVDLSKVSSVNIHFGRTQWEPSPAPVEIQDIRIFNEKQNIHTWELSEHHGDSVIDIINGKVAIADNPHWIIDDHINWNEIYHTKTSDIIQTAFNPRNENFYIVSENKITIFNPEKNSTEEIPVIHDGRIMKYSNYLTYDSLTNELISYSHEIGKTSRFNFESRNWSLIDDNNNEPSYANHGFVADGEFAYLFGGYGFHLFNNNLVRLDLSTGEMEELSLTPHPEPRTTSALCVANGKLYIFGGRGNNSGKQELPLKTFCDLWEYDMKTMVGKKLWETDTIRPDVTASPTMYYSENDSSFYLASTVSGGCMIKIKMNSPGYSVVSDRIHNKMDYRDCVFNLYRGANGKNYYLVIDKRSPDLSHDYTIYKIVYPFRDNPIYRNIAQGSGTSNKSFIWWNILIVSICLGLFFVALIFFRKRKKNYIQVPSIDKTNVLCQDIDDVNKTINDDKKHNISENNANENLSYVEETLANNDDKSDNGELVSLISECENQIQIEDSQKDNNPFVLKNIYQEKDCHFDRSKSSICILGGMEIKNKNGEDIIPKFNTRLKALLAFMILYTKIDEKGVSFQNIDGQIWKDKDERSAKNNRNVYMRKLRDLLEEVGDISINYDKGYYKMACKNVFIDYNEVTTRLADSDEDSCITGEKLDELIELLLYGPLLPSMSYEWLDGFKSEYTEVSLHILNKLLNHAVEESNDALAYKIADTMTLHDQLCEEALIIKCRILSKRKMTGPAKKLYDRFCNEYKKSYGENYPQSFSQIFQ